MAYSWWILFENYCFYFGVGLNPFVVFFPICADSIVSKGGFEV